MPVEETNESVDYSELYEAANYRFGIDNVTDKTYDEYPLPGTWKPLESELYKFEIDIENTDFTEEETENILNEHEYSFWHKPDKRYEDNRVPHTFIVVVHEDSKPIPHDNPDDNSDA